jgi:superfamily II helicase
MEKMMKLNSFLKTFDAKNIAGRAGRFLYHYSGRVLVFKKEFTEIINGKDDEIKHKNYDKNSSKDEIDYFITEDKYLDINDINIKNEIEIQRQERGIPLEIIQPKFLDRLAFEYSQYILFRIA